MGEGGGRGGQGDVGGGGEGGREGGWKGGILARLEQKGRDHLSTIEERNCLSPPGAASLQTAAEADQGPAITTLINRIRGICKNGANTVKRREWETRKQKVCNC